MIFSASNGAKTLGPGQNLPLVSILIPAYNAQEFIADTLRSALAQTWPHKQIIVVDDGSSDRTVEIVKQFAPQGVRLVLQKNQGAAAARNKAFSVCQGDYIQWLDADDLLHPGKISAQMEVLLACPGKRTLVSGSWAMFLYRYARAEFKDSGLYCDLSPTEWLLRKIGDNLYMQTATWLVSRELTLAAGPWDSRLLVDDDGEYFCRVLLACNKILHVSEAKVFYRGPGLAFGSLSWIGNSTPKREAFWFSMKRHIKTLRSLEDSPRVHEACLRYLQLSFNQFYPDQRAIVSEAQQLAQELGGRLERPVFSRKYSWIEKLFGYNAARQSQLALLTAKWRAKRHIDHLLCRLKPASASVPATAPQPYYGYEHAAAAQSSYAPSFRERRREPRTSASNRRLQTHSRTT